MDQLTTILESLGLNATQAKLYLAGLGLGSAPIARIAQKADVHRVTAYDSMKVLVTQGLFIEEKKGTTSFYQPIHPDLLWQKQIQKANEIEQLLPQLHDLMSHDPITPRIQFVQGLESCKQICLQLLEHTTQLDCLLGSPIRNPDMIGFIDGTFETKRIKKQILQRVVCCSSDVQHPVFKEQKKRLRQKVIVPVEMLTIQCGIYLYDTNKIMYNFFSNEEMSALIIESKQLATTRRSLFTYFWSITQ